MRDTTRLIPAQRITGNIKKIYIKNILFINHQDQNKNSIKSHKSKYLYQLNELKVENPFQTVEIDWGKTIKLK